MPDASMIKLGRVRRRKESGVIASTLRPARLVGPLKDIPTHLLKPTVRHASLQPSLVPRKEANPVVKFNGSFENFSSFVSAADVVGQSIGIAFDAGR